MKVVPPRHPRRLAAMMKPGVRQIVVMTCLLLLPGHAPQAAGGAGTLLGTTDALRCYQESLTSLSAGGEVFCDRALAHDRLNRRDRAATLSNRGIIRAQHGDFDGALADHRAALALAPHLSQILINCGNVHYRLRDFEAALADYDRAIAADPSLDALPWVNRALALLRLQRRDDAEASLLQALELQPHDARATRLAEQLRAARDDAAP